MKINIDPKLKPKQPPIFYLPIDSSREQRDVRDINPKLKPLYANLLRLEIWQYLMTDHFDYLCIENDIDQLWNQCKDRATFHFDVDITQTFSFFLMELFEIGKEKFLEILSKILVDFAERSDEDKDFSKVRDSLLKLGYTQDEIKDTFPTLKKSHEVKALVKFPTPEGTRWEDVTMQLVSNDSMRIAAQNVSERLTYAEMGFKDERKGDLPDKQWEALKKFAYKKGEISWDPGVQLTEEQLKIQSKIQSRVKTIRKRLKDFMGIDNDPFYSYRAFKAYKTKFKIEDLSYGKE